MTHRPYPSYKDSGIEWLGEVPEHWEVKPVKTVASCNDDVLDETTADDFEMEYVEISGVEAIAGIAETTTYRFKDAPSRARRLVQDGDVLVSTVRTYLRAITPIVKPPENLVVSTGFAVIRPSKIESHFLGYQFRTEYVISEVISRSVGVSYPAINASELMRIDVCLPPLPEQQAIAAFLDRETAKIDGLVAEQERLIELLTEKRQAVISHAVTHGLDSSVPLQDSDVEWLGQVPEHWEVKRIKDVVSRIEQGWSPQCEGFPVESVEEWGVLKVGCVNGGNFNEAENKRLPDELEPLPELGIKCGDVLISRANTRELVGSAAVAEQDYPNLLLCDKLYRLRVQSERLLARFLVSYLGTGFARGQIEIAATGASSSMQNISQGCIYEMLMPLPPLPEQQAIAAYLEEQTARFDALMAEARRGIELLKERRTALISAAVTGKIDVREAA